MNYRYRGENPYVTYCLIALNIIYFLYLEIAGSGNDILFMVESGALFAPVIEEHHQYWRFVTAMFMHFGINHIVNNMLLLFVLGEILEQIMGKVRYVSLYLISGVGANVICYFLYLRRPVMVVLAGASGAVFGLIGAMIYVAVKSRGEIGSMTAKRLILMTVLSIGYSLTDPTISFEGHAAGVVLGIALSVLLYRRQN